MYKIYISSYFIFNLQVSISKSPILEFSLD